MHTYRHAQACTHADTLYMHIGACPHAHFPRRPHSYSLVCTPRLTGSDLSYGEQEFWARVACVCGPHLCVTLCHASQTGPPPSPFSPPFPLCSLPGSHLTLKEPLLIPHGTISIMFLALLHVLITAQKRNQRKSHMSRPRAHMSRPDLDSRPK